MRRTDLEIGAHLPLASAPRRLPYLMGHGFIYLGLLLVLLVGMWLVIKTVTVVTAYHTAENHAASLESALAHGNTAKLQAELPALTTALDTLQTELPPLLPPAWLTRPLPVIGPDLAALPPVLAAGTDLSRAGAGLLWLAQAETVGQLVERLAQAQDELTRMDATFQRHQQALAGIDVLALSPVLAHHTHQLQTGLAQAQTGLQLAQQLPRALGFESPQTYLILTQNADELRPAGGYINTAGHVTLDRGQIIDFSMQDSYAIDRLSVAYPYPPPPLRTYMQADYWLLRDAGWSPDFPEAARTALNLYALGQGIRADGVIALDQQALPTLLQATGPLQVDSEQVTPENVIALMQKHWAPTAEESLQGPWWAQRKSFMLALAQALVRKFERSPDSIHIPALAAALQQTLAERHLLLYLEDESLAAALQTHHLDGGLVSAGGDYLLVADANVGFNKASALVERFLNYQVQLTVGGGVRARAQLVYQHTAPARAADCAINPRYDRSYAENMNRCYWDYVTLVIPAATRLISGPQFVIEGQYLLTGQPTQGQIDRQRLPTNKQGWSQLFLLRPGARVALDFTYRLPAGTVKTKADRKVYTLYLQKQPGTRQPAAQVLVTLPDGARLLQSTPQPLRQENGRLLFQLRLTTDRQIQVTYTE